MHECDSYDYDTDDIINSTLCMSVDLTMMMSILYKTVAFAWAWILRQWAVDIIDNTLCMSVDLTMMMPVIE